MCTRLSVHHQLRAELQPTLESKSDRSWAGSIRMWCHGPRNKTNKIDRILDWFRILIFYFFIWLGMFWFVLNPSLVIRRDGSNEASEESPENNDDVL